MTDANYLCNAGDPACTVARAKFIAPGEISSRFHAIGSSAHQR
jgi:hypothetical protein